MIGWKENKGADPDIENVPEPDPNLVGSEFRNPSNLSLYLGIYTYKTSFKKINNLDHLIREKKCLVGFKFRSGFYKDIRM